MNEQETTADIIAWLRKPREGENAYLTLWRDEIADRLEAAWKRDTKELRVEIERLKEERNYSGVRERERLRANGFAIVPKEQLERGNAAELREALEKIHTIAKTFIDATKMRRVTDSARLDVSNIKDLADAALATLAAPPRNCDRFATVDEARKAHEEYRGDYIMRASNKFDFPMEFEAWLFAPATEKEGGNDANE